MALFTNKADQKLPWLTQFYQSEGEWEIFCLAKQCDRAHGGGWDKFDFMSTSPENYSSAEIASVVSPLIDFQPMVKMYMDACADDALLTRDFVEEFSVMLLPGAANLVLAIGGTDEEREDLISLPDEGVPATGLVIGISSRFPHLFLDLVEEIKETTRYRRRKNLIKFFARCEECGSSFMIQSEGQRYCSQRCRARVGERRRYAVRMEGYPTRKQRKS